MDERKENPGDEATEIEHKLDGIEDEGDCGWFSFHPTFLQKFNNPAGYLCVYSIFLTTQGLLVSGYTNVVLSTLERQFRLQSFQAGLIVISYEVGYFLLCLFVTYYGNKAHRPRMLAISAVVFGVGALIFSIPHFTTGQYVYGDNYSDLCDPLNKPPSCDTSSEGDDLDGYFYLFIMAMLIQGFGCISLYTVGYAVIEDSLSKEKSALYIGIANTMTIIGPCLGFAIGGLSLTIYVDFDTVNPDEIDLEPSDPRWVGAWWIGYLVAGGMAWVLVAIPMSGFPKQFPGSAIVRSQKVSEVHAGVSDFAAEKEGFGDSIKDFPRATYLMLRNTPYLFTTFAAASESFIVFAFTAFLPKYLQTQFNLTTAEAGVYAGLIAIPGGVFGVIISPIIINRWKLNTPQILKMCIISCAVVLVMAPVCFMHCSTTAVAGATVPYTDDLTAGNLSTSCNSDCDCQGEYFSPVCGTDNLTYFSSCFAGCRRETESGSFAECACIQDAKSVADPGLCVEPCNVLGPFLAMFFIIITINFMTGTPVLLIIMRCVPESQKSFAIGVQFWIVRPLGAIPGPIVFGLIFDAACKLWQESECSDQGSCWIHDTDDVAVYVTVTSVLSKCFSVLFFSLALYFYKPVGTISGDKAGQVDFEDNSSQRGESVCKSDKGKCLGFEDTTTQL